MKISLNVHENINLHNEIISTVTKGAKNLRKCGGDLATNTRSRFLWCFSVYSVRV